jgi:calcineurin-like phosphoesterase
MLTLTTSPALTAYTTQRVLAAEISSLFESILPFAETTKLNSATRFFVKAHITSKKNKTGYTLIIILSIMTVTTIAATDCEILNSGILSISSTSCCTEADGIICEDERVIEMYELYLTIQ